MILESNSSTMQSTAKIRCFRATKTSLIVKSLEAEIALLRRN